MGTLIKRPLPRTFGAPFDFPNSYHHHEYSVADLRPGANEKLSCYGLFKIHFE